MKNPRAVGLIVTLICCHAWIPGVGAESPGSDSCASAWTTYLAHPSKTNGERLYKLLPQSREQAREFDSACRKSLYARVGSLRARVDKQERIAVKVPFRLFTVSDGEFGESLDQILGSLIRRNPTMFLEELNIHRSLVPGLGGLLGNLGDEFVDQTSKRQRELGLRIASLRSVQKKALSSLRNECIAKLTSRLQSTP